MEGSEERKTDTKEQNTAPEKITDSTTAGVLKEFAAFCRFPHGSGNEEKIAEYLSERLKKEGLSPETDSAGNLICDIPASGGCGEAPLTVLQGHMDMVCAALDDSYCPETDPVILEAGGREGKRQASSAERRKILSGAPTAVSEMRFCCGRYFPADAFTALCA